MDEEITDQQHQLSPLANTEYFNHIYVTTTPRETADSLTNLGIILKKLRLLTIQTRSESRHILLSAEKGRATDTSLNEAQLITLPNQGFTQQHLQCCSDKSSNIWCVAVINAATFGVLQ